MTSYYDGLPLTTKRRDYILRQLARNLPNESAWIRISEHEFRDFGAGFFQGCTVTEVGDAGWFPAKAMRGHSQEEEDRGTQVRLPIKIVAPIGGWSPGVTAPASFTIASNTTTSSSQYYRTIEPTHEGKKNMQEHHIDRQELMNVISANKEAYEEAFTTYRDLYSGQLSRESDRHLRGEITASQIAVRDKDNNLLTMLLDMSSTFDDQLRELDLDSRETVILTHEEYGQYVNGDATNLKKFELGIQKLEELP